MTLWSVHTGEGGHHLHGGDVAAPRAVTVEVHHPTSYLWGNGHVTQYEGDGVSGCGAVQGRLEMGGRECPSGSILLGARATEITAHLILRGAAIIRRLNEEFNVLIEQAVKNWMLKNHFGETSDV